MENVPDPEEVEVDATRVISLEFSRDWPRYALDWSVRFRSGDKNYPIGAGRVEALPAQDQQVDEMWEHLRVSAMSAAQGAIEARKTAEESRPSLRRRLFGGSNG
jgi:hypothetical protein